MKFTNMSRIGKQPIFLPSGVAATIDHGTVVVKGPKGELKQSLHAHVNAELVDGVLKVSVRDVTDKHDRALWGLFRALIQNMVNGVSLGFEKKLEVNGVGYKAQVSGKKLVLNLGYSHPIEFQIPDGIAITVEKNIITIGGSDKQRVGEIASQIRAFRKPEPYKGKGIKYSDEHVRRKVGKVMKSGE